MYILMYILRSRARPRKRLVPKAGLEPALPCGKGILSRKNKAANQRFVDSLPCFITRITGSDRILRALWTPRWTPEGTAMNAVSNIRMEIGSATARASSYHADVVTWRWVVVTRHRGRSWEVVVTAYPTERN